MAPAAPQLSMALSDALLDLATQEEPGDATCHVRFGDTFHSVSEILLYLGRRVVNAGADVTTEPACLNAKQSPGLWT